MPLRRRRLDSLTADILRLHNEQGTCMRPCILVHIVGVIVIGPGSVVPRPGELGPKEDCQMQAFGSCLPMCLPDQRCIALPRWPLGRGQMGAPELLPWRKFHAVVQVVCSEEKMAANNTTNAHYAALANGQFHGGAGGNQNSADSVRFESSRSTTLSLRQAYQIDGPDSLVVPSAGPSARQAWCLAGCVCGVYVMFVAAWVSIRPARLPCHGTFWSRCQRNDHLCFAGGEPVRQPILHRTPFQPKAPAPFLY